jgi:hypothetical protein
MARLIVPVPATIAAVPSPTRYTSEATPPAPAMRPMTDAAYQRYNAILRQWRSEGRRISWAELREAHQLATEGDR